MVSVASSEQASAVPEEVPSTPSTSTPNSKEIVQASSLPVPESSLNSLPAVARSGGKVQPAADMAVGSPSRGRKRGGVSSTPSSPTLSVPTSNKFEVLSEDASVRRKGSPPSKTAPTKKIRVEIHNPGHPDSGQVPSRNVKSQNMRYPAGSAGGPSLSRQNSHQSVKKRSQKVDGDKRSK